MDQRQLDAVVTEVSSFAQRNTSLDDVSGKVLAHSTLTPTTDRARIDSVLLGVVPDYIMRLEASVGVGRHTKPFHMPGREQDGRYDRICIPLIVRGVRVGAIWILANDPSDDLSTLLQTVQKHQDFFDQLAGKVLVALGTSNPLMPKYDRILQLALEGTRNTFSDEYDQLFLVDGARQVVVFSALHHVADKPTIPALAYQQAMFDAGRAMGTTVIGYADEKHGVALILNDVSVEEFTSQIEGFLQLRSVDSGTETLSYGLSGSLASWKSVRDHYLQATIALQATAVDPTLQSHNFSDIGIYHYLFNTVSVTHSERFLALTSAQDSAKLLNILETVYDTPGTMQSVANALFMHRTSVYNYLQRIERIIGSDPLDPLVRLELHTALKILRWERRPRLKPLAFTLEA